MNQLSQALLICIIDILLIIIYIYIYIFFHFYYLFILKYPWLLKKFFPNIYLLIKQMNYYLLKNIKIKVLSK